MLGLLDVDLLAAVGAGSDNTVTLAQAQVRSPSDPGYVPTAPPAMTPGGRAGSARRRRLPVEQETPSTAHAARRRRAPRTGRARGRISKDGEQLTLVLGVAANDPTSVAVANTAADQLRSVGIAASVSALDPVVLYGDALVEEPGRRDRRLASRRAAIWPRRWRRATAARRWRPPRCPP